MLTLVSLFLALFFSGYNVDIPTPHTPTTFEDRILRNPELLTEEWPKFITPGGFPISRIFYVDAHGDRITKFENIHTGATAHILLNGKCPFWKKETIIFSSTSCSKDGCIFPPFFGYSFQKISDTLFGTISDTIYEYEISDEFQKYYLKKIEENPNTPIGESMDIDIPKHPGWKVSDNVLQHPTNGIIPVLFSGDNSCDRLTLPPQFQQFED